MSDTQVQPSRSVSPQPSPSRFHVVIKPLGSLCNIACEYCFYLCKHASGMSTNRLMTDEALEAFIRQYIEGQSVDEVYFSWLGGEPTLLGIDFYRQALEMQRRYQRPGLVIYNDIQTNGVLIDEQWGQFLKEHNFLVGVSLDGPQDLHDRYRHDAQGRGSFSRVMNAIRILQKYGVEFQTL